MRGFVVGILGLALLERSLRSRDIVGRVGTAGDIAAFFVRKFVDPHEPAFGGTRYSERNRGRTDGTGGGGGGFLNNVPSTRPNDIVPRQTSLA